MSYNCIAAFLDSSQVAFVSKQALQKSMVKKRFLFFVLIVFKQLLVKKIKNDSSQALLKCARFKRIIVQDSTIVKLPNRLFFLFSGVSNGVGKTANARIQYAFDIINEQVKYFSIDSYSKNDLSQTRRLIIKMGDLILRDRGYLTYDEITRIIQKGADFIFRYKFKIKCLSITTNATIDILKLLKKHQNLDIKVRLNDKNGPIVRIVAVPINQELADRRRSKLKKEASSKPSKENLEIQSWSIYITSIPKQEMNFVEIFSLYKLRWRVEILFKTMKSGLKLDSIHNVSNTQLQFIIYAKLMFLVITMQFIYLPAAQKINEQLNKELSILKLITYLAEDKMRILETVEELLNENKLIGPKLNSIARYCTYDKRKRQNYHKFASEIILS